MDRIKNYNSLALGVLLMGAGFLGGYVTGEHGGSQRQAYAAAPVSGLETSTQHRLPPHKAPRRHENRSVEIYQSSESPHTTVVIIENAGPPHPHHGPAHRHPEVSPDDPAMTNSAPPNTKQNATMLALLLLTAMPALTWAALAWNRRRVANSDISESVYQQEFVPRRDD